MASAGWPNATGWPSTSNARSRDGAPGEDLEELVLALTFQGHDAQDLPGRSSNETSTSLVPS